MPNVSGGIQGEGLVMGSKGYLLFCNSIKSMVQNPKRAFHRQSILLTVVLGNVEAKKKASLHAAQPHQLSREPHCSVTVATHHMRCSAFRRPALAD